jgi:hypothetical protein
MPKDSRPLSPSQIATIRKWIAEGAKDDESHPNAYRTVLVGVPVTATRATRVLVQVNTTAYITVIAKDPVKKSVLWTEVGSLKIPKEPGDMGKPGDTICWDVRGGSSWPASVDFELTVQYATEELRNVEFRANVVEDAPLVADAGARGCHP